MIQPVRIQRKRTRGFNLQAASTNGLPVVYVGRPSKYGNPATLQNLNIMLLETKAKLLPLRRQRIQSRPPTLDDCVTWYADAIAESPLYLLGWTLEEMRRDLAGKNLSCWCPLDRCCHADILLRYANA